MVEQLHFHSSKWLFSLSTCELLIKIGKDIIHIQRADITIWDILKDSKIVLNQRSTSFTFPPTLVRNKQTNKKPLTIRPWCEQMQGRKLRELRCPERTYWQHIALFAANELNLSSCMGEHLLHWRSLTQMDELLCGHNPHPQNQALTLATPYAIRSHFYQSYFSCNTNSLWVQLYSIVNQYSIQFYYKLRINLAKQINRSKYLSLRAMIYFYIFIKWFFVPLPW